MDIVVNTSSEQSQLGSMYWKPLADAVKYFHLIKLLFTTLISMVFPYGFGTTREEWTFPKGMDGFYQLTWVHIHDRDLFEIFIHFSLK